MKAHIIQIGNSRGIRLPKAWLQACDLVDVNEVDVEIKKKGLVILRPSKNARAGWGNAFKKMAAMKNDGLLIPDNVKSDWDKNEWEW